MTVVAAGIDIGNSTTEVVLLEERDGVRTVLASARGMTRGPKGSPDSVLAAARLARRTAAREDVDLTVARVAPWRPVHTTCRSVVQEAPRSGPLRVVTRSARTAAGDGVALGRPVAVDIAATAGDEDIVVVVGAHVGYAEAAVRTNEALKAGIRVVGVLVQRDEAVLVANRLDRPLPVIDQVPIEQLETATLVALEARPAGQPLRQIADPYWLCTSFGISVSSPGTSALVQELEDASFAVVALTGCTADAVPAAPRTVDEVVWKDGSRSPLSGSLSELRAADPGAVAAIQFQGGACSRIDDLFVASLEEIARAAHTRRGSLQSHRIVMAALDADTAEVAEVGVLEKALDVPVEVACSEAQAGRAGALSTPGAPGDAVVVDLGAGTVDVSDGAMRCVAAGAGELLTRVTAEALGIPLGTAEYAKRGPALHVDSPQIVEDENGARSFLDVPVPGSAVGALCIEGPVGLAPFNRSLALGEWRAWRTTAKAYTIGFNVARAMSCLGSGGAASVVLVGGAAGDDEAVAAVSRSLPIGSRIGRGNVAGSLGHRFAVAYGLALGGVGPT